MARIFVIRFLIALVVAAPLAGCGSSGTNADGGDAADTASPDATGAAGTGGDAAAGAGAGGTAGTGTDGGMAGAGTDGGEAGTGLDAPPDTSGPDAGPDAPADANDVTDVRAERATSDAAGAPGAPTNLAAAVLDRRQTSFQLSWTAPATALGGAVTTYDVRVAKVPITAANFDDPSAGVIPYKRTPAVGGQQDGVAVTGLYVENDYYFAVAAVDASGNRGAIAATAAATTAHFNVTTINSTSATAERFGFSVSGDGDVNGDGLADILVGTTGVGRAYLFLGKSNFASSAPAVTFTGAATGFGFRVAQVGDLDNDGRPDVAIADPQVGNKVYIYKGRATWPATLTDAQADYVIDTDATYQNSLFGFSLARLGDFTGDGVDDLGIGARSYGGGVGRVIIVPGRTGFTSVTLPNTTLAITIDGNPAFGSSAFGYKVLGLGHFYNATGGTTLVVSAPSGSLSTPTAVGHVYAFHGQTGTAGAIAIGSADHSVAGNVANAKIGVTLTNLGKMFNGFPGVGVGNTLDTAEIAGANGTSYLTSGTPATGPFTSSQIAYLSGATAASSVIIGGGVSGRDMSLSLIGDGAPDLVMSGGATGGTLAIADGAMLAAKGSPVDLALKAEVRAPLPAGWGSGENAGTIVTDIDGDGATDFCIGSVTNPGTILVYW
jgi:hypothetical protein